jgi:hypothetical protein
MKKEVGSQELEVRLKVLLLSTQHSKIQTQKNPPRRVPMCH